MQNNIKSESGAVLFCFILIKLMKLVSPKMNI